MLCFFSVRNFKGFRDTISLDLSAANYEFNHECVHDGLVQKALIYGYNGVGKSNLGFAIMDIIINLTDKEKEPLLTGNYRNAETEGEVVEFNYRFKFGGSLVEYRYGKTGPQPQSLVYEYLSVNGKSVVSYNRAENRPLAIDLPGAQTLNKNIAKIQISALKYVRSNAALEPSPEARALSSLFDFADGMLFFRNLDDRTYAGYAVGAGDLFTGIINNNRFDDFVSFLASAGVPSNIEYQDIGGKYEVFFAYETEQKKKNVVSFFKHCSAGMRSLAVFFYWMQNDLFMGASPSFVFIDEFDAFYHKRMSELVVKKIKEKKGCQFILTTHDTGIMSNDLMRPDCLFLMGGGKASALSTLTDKELRFAHNIEKMYRAGAFDG